MMSVVVMDVVVVVVVVLTLNFGTSVEKCDDIWRIRTSNRIIRNKIGIIGLIKQENRDPIHHFLLFHECVKIEGIIYIHFVTFDGASIRREICDLLNC